MTAPRPHRPRVLAPLVLLSASLGLCGVDWPERGRTLEAESRAGTPAQRADALVRAAASNDASSRQQILDALASQEPVLRSTALQLALRYRLEGAAPLLLSMLEATEVTTRAEAAAALGTLGGERATGALVRALGDADPLVRRAAVTALPRAAGAGAVVPLLDRLADPEPGLRTECARVLGDLGDPRSVLSLLGNLQDSVPEVRTATATALGRLRDARAVPNLRSLLRDPQLEVRLAAIRALGAIGSPESITDLAPVATRDLRAVPDPASRSEMARAAIEALGRIDSRQARSALVRVLREGGDATLARAAAEALQNRGAAARDSLDELLAPPLPSAAQDLVLRLLATLGGERALEQLVGMVESEGSAELRNAALGALGALEDARAVWPLLRALDRVSQPQEAPRGALRVANALPLEPLRAGILALEAQARRRPLPPESLDPLLALLQRFGASRPAGQTQSAGELRSLELRLLRLLGATGNPRLGAALGPYLTSQRRELRAAAATALVQVGVEGSEEVAASALGDSSSDVRLAVADALARRGTAAAARALSRVWSATRPIDRVHAARALGRILARFPDPRAEGLLLDALAGAEEPLAAALLDALAGPASAGSALAREALLQALRRETLRTAAAEALANALAQSTGAARAALRAAVDPHLRSEDARVRATLLWGLRGGDAADTAVLLEALRDASPAVAANAAGALASGAAAGAPVRDALCGVLREGYHSAARANALRALLVGGQRCEVAALSRALQDSRLAPARRSAAELLTRLAREEGAPAQDVAAARSALQRCSTDDRDAQVAASCREGLAPPSATQAAAPAQDAIDLLLVDDDGEGGRSFAAALLERPDGLLRWAWSGPSGWLHERPVPEGEFRVRDPASLPQEQ